MSVDLASPREQAAVEPEPYRALSTLAVVTLALGVLSFLTLLNWRSAVIPVVGLVTATLAWRRIARHPLELTGLGLVKIGGGLSLAFLTGGSALHSYVYLTEVPDGYQRISYDDLRVPANGPLAAPDSAQALDGQRVFIKGYVFAGTQSSNLREFLLMRHAGQCCFGPAGPPPGDQIRVRMQDGRMVAEYAMRPYGLGGVLRVVPPRDEGAPAPVLYVLEANYVK